MNEQSLGARELAVLERLAHLGPHEDVFGALKALQHDQNIYPLIERFNLARGAVRQMQAEAGAGAWLIALLEQHLDQIGVPGVRLGLRQRLCAWLARQLQPYLLDLISEAVAQLQAELRADLAKQRASTVTGEINGRPVQLRRFIGDS